MAGPPPPHPPNPCLMRGVDVPNINNLTPLWSGSQEVCGWINAKASIPVWAKMTPNITDITVPARTALAAGCEGVAAINTITSVMGINLDTLRPEPSVEGYSTPGGYSSKAVKPIALAKVGPWRLHFAGDAESHFCGHALLRGVSLHHIKAA